MAKSVTVRFDSEIFKKLESRAKDSYLDVDELIEDIVRRSMLSYKGRVKQGFNVDDPLVNVFSRDRRGRKRKKKAKKNTKK